MCLAIPGIIVSRAGDEATLDYGGVRKTASALLFPAAAPGQRALVHAGFIIQILPPDEGLELEKLVRETLGEENG